MQPFSIAPRDRLIVALDVPSVAAAEAMIARLGDSVTFYKIGYQLAFAGGLGVAEQLARAGKQVFLDLKLHDIGNTVGAGVASVARLGAALLTVHAYPQTMRAAIANARSRNTWPRVSWASCTRLTQSMAFLSSAGTDELYSGVTISTP